VELCLSPSGIIQELEARLLPPNGNAILVNLQSKSPGAACLTGGTLFSIDILPSDLPSATTLTGDWRLFVRDVTTNNINGYFVGWSFTMTGLK
jgi:subtilisin-like proprotein convertase family protein